MNPDDEYTPEQIQERFERTLRVMLNTPPRPQQNRVKRWRNKLKYAGLDPAKVRAQCRRCKGKGTVIHEGGYRRVPCPSCSIGK